MSLTWADFAGPEREPRRTPDTRAPWLPALLGAVFALAPRNAADAPHVGADFGARLGLTVPEHRREDDAGATWGDCWNAGCP